MQGLREAAASPGNAELRFSLLDGTYHYDDSETASSESRDPSSTALALRMQSALQVTGIPYWGVDDVILPSEALSTGKGGEW